MQKLYCLTKKRNIHTSELLLVHVLLVDVSAVVVAAVVVIVVVVVVDVIVVLAVVACVFHCLLLFVFDC